MGPAIRFLIPHAPRLLNLWGNVDTVRYSVPPRFARDHVEVVVEEARVRIVRGTELIATHQRSREPHARVVNPAHWEGLWRRPSEDEAKPTRLTELGRSLDEYPRLIERGAA